MYERDGSQCNRRLQAGYQTEFMRRRAQNQHNQLEDHRWELRAMCQRRQRRQRHRRCHTERDHHQVLYIAERLDSAWIQKYLSDQDPTMVRYRAGARGK